MALAHIEIEEHRPGHWVAQVEVGFPVCRKESVRGASWDELISAVIDSYARMQPKPKPTGETVIEDPPKPAAPVAPKPAAPTPAAPVAKPAAPAAVKT